MTDILGKLNKQFNNKYDYLKLLNVVYDKDYFHTFHGKNFFIKEFLH